MKIEQHIPIIQLCKLYEIESSFIVDLSDFGLIELRSIKETYFIHEDKISAVEQMIRLHQELGLNIEGIDVAINLLDKIEKLQNRLTMMENRLKIHEEEL